MAKISVMPEVVKIVKNIQNVQFVVHQYLVFNFFQQIVLVLKLVAPQIVVSYSRQLKTLKNLLI